MKKGIILSFQNFSGSSFLKKWNLIRKICGAGLPFGENLPIMKRIFQYFLCFSHYSRLKFWTFYKLKHRFFFLFSIPVLKSNSRQIDKRKSPSSGSKWKENISSFLIFKWIILFDNIKHLMFLPMLVVDNKFCSGVPKIEYHI